MPLLVISSAHPRASGDPGAPRNGDKVVAIGHYDMTQKRTGKPLSSDWVHIITFARGKLVAWRELNDSAAFYNACR